MAEVALASGWKKITFLDHAWPERTKNDCWSIVGKVEALAELYKNNTAAFVSIGNNAVRERIFCENRLLEAPCLVHPSAIVSPRSQLGTGVLVVAGAIVNISSEIGDGVILNTGCTVDHDCRIGSFVHISPGAHLAGRVTVGARSWIGIGACVREGVTIGSDVTIGAGAAVVSDIPNRVVVAGVPARSLSP